MGFPLEDGYHVLPPGKLAAVVTWLEIRERPGDELSLPDGVELVRDSAPDPVEYHALFRTIGEPWLWFGRLESGIEDLRRLLAKSSLELYYLQAGGETIGLLELDRREASAVEIVYFGLVGGWTGRGIGKAFMAQALRLAWNPATERVWLHTCTLDHPAAMSFYRKCGFRPYQRGLEIYDDPRLSGLLPKAAAPQVPLL